MSSFDTKLFVDIIKMFSVLISELVKSRNLYEINILFMRTYPYIVKFILTFISLYLYIFAIGVTYLNNISLIRISTLTTITISSFVICSFLYILTILACSFLHAFEVSMENVGIGKIAKIFISLVVLMAISCLIGSCDWKSEDFIVFSLFCCLFIIVYFVSVFLVINDKFNFISVFIIVLAIIGSVMLFKGDMEFIVDRMLYNIGLCNYMVRINYLQNNNEKEIVGKFKFSDIKYTYIEHSVCGKTGILSIKNKDILSETIFR